MHTVKITEENKKLIQVGSKLKRFKNHKRYFKIGQIYRVCLKIGDGFCVKDDVGQMFEIDLENFELVINKTYGLWI